MNTPPHLSVTLWSYWFEFLLVHTLWAFDGMRKLSFQRRPSNKLHTEEKSVSQRKCDYEWMCFCLSLRKLPTRWPTSALTWVQKMLFSRRFARTSRWVNGLRCSFCRFITGLMGQLTAVFVYFWTFIPCFTVYFWVLIITFSTSWCW